MHINDETKEYMMVMPYISRKIQRNFFKIREKKI